MPSNELKHEGIHSDNSDNIPLVPRRQFTFAAEVINNVNGDSSFSSPLTITDQVSEEQDFVTEDDTPRLRKEVLLIQPMNV